MGDIADDRPRGKYPVLWIVWAVIAVGGFFAIEIPALSNDSGGDTLTEHIQFLGGYSPWALVGIVVGFAAWLVDHFVGPKDRKSVV